MRLNFLKDLSRDKGRAGTKTIAESGKEFDDHRDVTKSRWNDKKEHDCDVLSSLDFFEARAIILDGPSRRWPNTIDFYK